MALPGALLAVKIDEREGPRRALPALYDRPSVRLSERRTTMRLLDIGTVALVLAVDPDVEQLHLVLSEGRLGWIWVNPDKWEEMTP